MTKFKTDRFRIRASVPKIPVASVVASGEYEIGLQQVSELLPVPGAQFVGRIPVGARHPDEARALLRYLASRQVQDTVRATGLDPIPAR